jgi:hypothetical protein
MTIAISKMDVRSLKYLKASQWFGNGIEALQFLAHRAV